MISNKRAEKKVLEVNHENIIVTLNDTMAEKAQAQIRLNETRDVLRETNQKVVKYKNLINNLNILLINISRFR